MRAAMAHSAAMAAAVTGRDRREKAIVHVQRRARSADDLDRLGLRRVEADQPSAIIAFLKGADQRMGASSAQAGYLFIQLGWRPDSAGARPRKRPAADDWTRTVGGIGAAESWRWIFSVSPASRAQAA